ncbi:HAD family hydrolase [Streptomyces violaceusniger]|uniref:HAD-superfamily hydrolase, subfamily IA, variant 1 n=1 Tax=Streptomyces violaceusniger (strain Tu 4113) TaxID=653045 RepID=G2NZ96_STRV4|nr:HAD family hydrolase [Streptomyces violaceusniger]AEM83139.1 HAD-superfamily hydrolase, subfamily IA, variant 1 [Streptomyces violaceusniger Tu 4113]
MIESVVFDIGSTLVREDRYWGDWADWLGVPRHTLSALVGAVVAQGRDDKDAIRLVRPGVDIDAEWRAREAAGRGEWLDESDVYPDVRSVLGGLRESGLRVVLAGNQSLRAGVLLRELGLPVDAVATSSEWGVAKPDPEFFRRVLELGGAAPGDTLYVGDHPAFDIRPAKAAGLRAAHIRRGPWAYLWADTADAAMADWRIGSLSELVEIVAEPSV